MKFDEWWDEYLDGVPQAAALSAWEAARYGLQEELTSWTHKIDEHVAKTEKIIEELLAKRKEK